MSRHWLAKKEVLAIHAMQLAWFGGAAGLRDEGVLDSALADPRMMVRRPEDTPALPVLAAVYADLAAGEISQNELAHWLSAHTCPVPK